MQTRRAIIVISVSLGFLLIFVFAIFWIGLPSPWQSYHYNVIGQPSVFSTDFEQFYNNNEQAEDGLYFMVRLQASGENEYFGSAPFQIRLAAFREIDEVKWVVDELSVIRGDGSVIFVETGHGRDLDFVGADSEIVVSSTLRMYRSGIWESGYQVDLDEKIDDFIFVIAIIRYEIDGIWKSKEVRREFRSEIRSGTFQPRH